MLSLLSCGRIAFKAQDVTVVPGLRWKLTVETLDSSRTESVITDCSQIPGITVEMDWKREGCDLVATAVVSNTNSDYVVKSLEGPFIEGLDFDIAEYNLIMPAGMGALMRRTPGEPDDRAAMPRENDWKFLGRDSVWCMTAGYPSRNMSMAWLAFASSRRGVSVTSHDPQRKGKFFSVYYHPQDSSYSVAIRHLFTCFAGQSVDVPETRIHPYEGTWHRAADYYRAWFEKDFRYAHQPQWLKECSGWLLAITKQQNEEIMYDYPDFGAGLSDAAIERGLDVIGLFGWAHGGHDRFYPDYLPDPVRGGEPALRKAIQDIKDRGLRTIMYVNGQLIDQNGTEYWADTGRFVTMTDKYGKLISETWHKYYDAPARTHGRACFSCDVWRKRMLSLAVMAEEYGADGIIYDQLATRNPVFCYGTGHGHSVPAVVVEQDRLEYITMIREAMSEINPEFIVMTEGVADYELGCINIFHGCSFDTYPPGQEAMEQRCSGAGLTWFPEMLAYTFPELLMTVRNPAPVTSRNMSNYTLMFHLKNELESRYRADVRYLDENRIPAAEDYRNVTTKPDLSMVIAQDPGAMKDYQKKLADFQTANQDLLRLGRFIDTEGFSFCPSHPCAMAKAYTNGDEMGVVVWNISADEPLSYDVKVDGMKLAGISAPDREISEGEPLAPESIVLLRFRKFSACSF